MPELTSIRVAGEIVAERELQDIKWGEQNHPDGTSQSFRTHAETVRDICDEAARNENVTWCLILLEEVFEALTETDPVKLRTELVQVAAVATAWVEAIDRRS